MRWSLPALVGLVLHAAPLGAQDYIDLEAERRQQQEAAAETAAPEPLYPEAADTELADTAAVPAAGDASAIREFYTQLQALQREVMELRGQVEEQAYQLRQLKQQSLERYVDLDRRLAGGAGSSDPAAGTTPPATPASRPATAPAQAQPGETDAYRAAYALVRSQRFDDAVAAFSAFLQDYPDGKYAPNAHYWLGELYLVITPQDLESSRRAFNLLLEQYPDNPKVPDALYKLGRVYYQKGDREKSREYLDRVIAEYGDSGSSAVGLARDFLSENF